MIMTLASAQHNLSLKPSDRKSETRSIAAVIRNINKSSNRLKEHHKELSFKTTCLKHESLIWEWAGSQSRTKSASKAYSRVYNVLIMIMSRRAWLAVAITTSVSTCCSALWISRYHLCRTYRPKRIKLSRRETWSPSQRYQIINLWASHPSPMAVDTV